MFHCKTRSNQDQIHLIYLNICNKIKDNQNKLFILIKKKNKINNYQILDTELDNKKNLQIKFKIHI